MATHTERTNAETMHRVKACKHVCAQQWIVELKGLWRSVEEGPGESRAKGVFGLGARLEGYVPLGVRLGGEEERTGSTGSTLAWFLHARPCGS